MSRRLLPSLPLLLAACGGGEAPLPRTTLTDGTGDYWFFAYSPDGTRLAMAQAAEGGVRLLLGSTDATDATPVTEPATFIGQLIWGADSRTLYFSSSQSGTYGLHAVAADGAGGIRRLATEYPVAIAMSAHREGGVLFSVGSDLFRLPPGDSVPVPAVTSRREEFVGLWSPDGTRIAYIVARDGREQIEVIPAAGGTPVLVGPPDGTVRGPTYTWTRDGSAVILAASPFGNMDLYVAPADGSTPRQLTRDIRDDWAPALSPDGNWVVFLSRRGGQHDVWIVPLAGGEPLRVTDDADEEWEPQWTPDGTGVVFAHGTAPAEVHLLSLADGATRRVVAMPQDALGAEISPDGQTVGFRMAYNGVAEIWTVPAAGGEPTPLTRDGAEKRQFAFSRDGTRIYYLAVDGVGTNIFSIPATGGEPTRMTGDAMLKYEFTRMSETADGTLLGFFGVSTDGGYEYFVVPTAGGDVRQVTDMAAVSNGALLPDGSAAIVTAYHEGGEAQLYRVPLAGGAARRLPTGPGWVFQAVPSADGRHLAYIQMVDGEIALHHLDLATETSRRLSPPGLSVNTYVWTPDGSALLVGFVAGQMTRLARLGVDGSLAWLTPEGTDASGAWPSADGSVASYTSKLFRRQLIKVDVARLFATP